jgi:hypothetical protein
MGATKQHMLKLIRACEWCQVREADAECPYCDTTTYCQECVKEQDLSPTCWACDYFLMVCVHGSRVTSE